MLVYMKWRLYRFVSAQKQNTNLCTHPLEQSARIYDRNFRHLHFRHEDHNSTSYFVPIERKKNHLTV